MARIGVSKPIAALAITAAVTLLAGCGGDGSEPPIATAATGEASASASASKTPALSSPQAELAAYLTAQRKWVSCLREYGLDPPDPDQYGRVIWRNIPVKADSGFEKGQQACKSLQSAPPPSVVKMASQPLTPAQIELKRRYSACMQKNGAPDFPDPGPDGEFPETTRWNQTSAGAARATEACASIIGDPAKSGPGVG